MNGVSLFSGAGGFEIGLERAGIRTVLQAENDPWCLEVLARHWPDVERVTDVRQVDAATFQGRRGDVVSVGASSDAEWPGAARGRGIDAAGIDLVYGGFPCQDVSVAGQRAGLSGERSGLWFEFLRVLRELRPRWTLVENVPGLLSSNLGQDFATILLGLEELGYGWAYRVLDARWFGIPQRRRRVFVVGCLGDTRRAAQVLAVCESCGGHPASRREARESVAGSIGTRIGRSGSPERHDVTLVNTLDANYGRLQGASLQDLNHGHSTLVTAGALRASDGHHGHSSPRGDGADNLIAFDWQTHGSSRTRPHVNGEWTSPLQGKNQDALSGAFGVRRLTPLECERLMGWPDEWTRWTADGREIPDSHRYRLCGNGVVSTVAEWIGHRLMAVERM